MKGLSTNTIEGRLPALHVRIRRLRAEKGLTGTDLAVRAGISTSYVSLIETGAKVPDEAAAARLARALDDDESLYRAWARAARLGLHDLAMLNELEAIARMPELATLVESGRELPPLEPATPRETAPDLAARLREVAFRLNPSALAARGAGIAPAGLAAPAVVRVPVLARGEGRPTLDHLLLDRRLFEDGVAERLFAYEVVDADEPHLRGIAATGDRVVLQPSIAVRPGRICAVRASGGVRLARALVADDRLVLLPGEGGSDVESVPLPAAGGAASPVLGTQALLLRS